MAPASAGLEPGLGAAANAKPAQQHVSHQRRPQPQVQQADSCTCACTTLPAQGTPDPTWLAQVEAGAPPGGARPAFLQTAQHQAVRHRPGKLGPARQLIAVEDPQPVQPGAAPRQAAYQAGQQLREALR